LKTYDEFQQTRRVTLGEVEVDVEAEVAMSCGDGWVFVGRELVMVELCRGYEPWVVVMSGTGLRG
jgi:hypothetical protein